MTTYQERPTKSKLPPRSTVPKWLQTYRGILNPMYYLEQTRDKYGDIFLTEFAGFPTQTIISDPQAIQAIFTADPKLFKSGGTNKILEPIIGANSLILSDGEPHLQKRKLLMPPFHGERMRAYGQTICDLTSRLIEQWKKGETISARPTMQKISLNVILQTIFGIKEGERYQQISKLLSRMLDVFDSPWTSAFLILKPLQKNLGTWSPWGKFLQQRHFLDQLLYQEIRDRRSQPDSLGEDILSLLLTVRNENGQPMSDVELRDELLGMLFAGHETTATALAWALYWIHYLPEVKEKLLQELNTIDLTTTNPAEIVRLPYLDAVCLETLRIYPIAPFTFGRTLQAPMNLVGYDLPKGMLLSICIYLVHHRKDLYPEPKQFRPERFLERQFSPYEYLPFGGSHRRCLGAAFALFEMKLVLATILSRCSLTLAEEKPLFPARRGITFAPAGGVHLTVG